MAFDNIDHSLLEFGLSSVYIYVATGLINTGMHNHILLNFGL